MIAQIGDATTIYADQLTDGDIIRHSTGDTWMVITEPEYTTRGITFEVLCEDAIESESTKARCGSRGGSRIEWKKINGYGPYPYLRFRSEGKYRSYYLKDLAKDKG